MATDYTYLLVEFPDTISSDQLYRICKISKRKAKWLLDNHIIPCQDSGKKTRRYRIKTIDVIGYLTTLERKPQEVAAPVGLFNSKVKKTNPIATIDRAAFQRFLYATWIDAPDAMTSKEIQALTGYSAGTVGQWICREKLNYLNGLATVITAKEQKYLDISDFAVDQAREMLGNKEWETNSNY